MSEKEQRKNKWQHSAKNRKHNKSGKHGNEEKPKQVHELILKTDNQKKEKNLSTEGELPLESFPGLKHETDEISNLSKTYSRRGVSSNWSKYELPREFDDDEEDGDDFGSLSNAPISLDGHFKFRSEKDWDTKTTLKYSEYFTLNMKTVSDGLNCIPFYKRHDIGDILSSDDIERMDSKAQTYVIKYEPILQSSKVVSKKHKKVKSDVPAGDNKISDKQKTIDPIEITKEKTNDAQGVSKECSKVFDVIQTENIEVSSLDKTDSATIKTTVPIVDTELDDLLKLTTPNVQTNDVRSCIVTDPILDEPDVIKRLSPPPKTTVDLEQWLDDILDD